MNEKKKTYKHIKSNYEILKPLRNTTAVHK